VAYEYLDGDCVQTITHPAISVWSVAVCAQNGDIVSGASDRIVRVFSREGKRWADKEALEVNTRNNWGSEYHIFTKNIARHLRTVSPPQRFHRKFLSGWAVGSLVLTNI